MRVRFKVLECCSTDLRRHCHRCPLSMCRHSRIRRPWMLSPPFPCRQRRHKGHPFGSFIVRVSRNITDAALSMRVVASSLRVAPIVSGTDLPGNLSGSRRLLFSFHPYSVGLASPVGSV